MSNLTININGERIHYRVEKVVVCNQCEFQFSTQMNEVECPECGSPNYSLLGERILEHNHLIWKGARTIDELSTRLRDKAEVIDTLAEQGWELEEPVVQRHAHLVRKGNEDS